MRGKADHAQYSVLPHGFFSCLLDAGNSLTFLLVIHYDSGNVMSKEAEMRILFVVMVAGIMLGCAHSAKDIDVSKVEPACAQRCSISYSRCVSEMDMKSSPLMSKCGEAYEACVGTCPAKQP
jgi:hypothetical protein